MSLSHDGFSYLSAKHSTVGPISEAELQLIVSQFTGVDGESHLVGGKTGRVISTRLTLEYNTEALLFAGIQQLQDKLGRLRGTLSVVGASSTYTFEQCTFMTYVMEPIDSEGNTFFKDGKASGQWIAFVRLFWRQRK